jgi:hypothetical protein
MRYISDIYISKTYEKDLSDSDFFSLYYFITNNKLSTYQLSEFLSITKYKMNYKNVLKKIKKFEKFQIIKIIEKRSHPRPANFFQLTDVGVYYIFEYMYERMSLFKNEQIIEIIHGLINYYSENDFFTVFIFPFFNKETLLNLKSETIMKYFLNYCKKCCYRVRLSLIQWDFFINSSPVIYWNNLINYNFDAASKNKTQRWLKDISQRFQFKKDKDIRNCLDWIDNDFSIDVENNDTILIIKNGNTLILRLDKHRRTLSFLFKKRNILQFDILPYDNDFLINKHDLIGKQSAFLQESMFDFMDYREIYLKENVVLPVINISKFKDIDIEYWKKIEKDIIHLIRDDKFYLTFMETLKDFKKQSKRILKFRV